MTIGCAKHWGYKLDFGHFIEYVFYGLISAVSVYIASAIKEMKISIESLNITLASESQKLNNFKETTDRHESVLDRHSERLLELEKKTFHCNGMKN